MIYYNKSEIKSMDKIYRLNLINSVTGIKPANLIGTVDNNGNTNLAIFSSVVHLGSNPAILGFILRPDIKVRRHSYENILEIGFYTINHVNKRHIKRAHYTSAKFDKKVSEFDQCNFEPIYLEGFQAPFVRESQLSLGMKYLESSKIEANGTHVVVGEIQHILCKEKAIDSKGHIDLSKLGSVGISGLNSYYQLEKIEEFEYARPENLPDFTNS
jgi:flavin reductase (DIM6/NTAB) family NADH-FMN oxidoreductase RutF